MLKWLFECDRSKYILATTRSFCIKPQVGLVKTFLVFTYCLPFSVSKKTQTNYQVFVSIAVNKYQAIH